jgi:hypothetical protein
VLDDYQAGVFKMAAKEDQPFQLWDRPALAHIARLYRIERDAKELIGFDALESTSVLIEVAGLPGFTKSKTSILSKRPPDRVLSRRLN